MIDPTTIQYPWDGPIQFLNNLPAYNGNQGVDSLLDLAREIQQSGNYYYEGLVFPNLEVQPTIPALGTLSGVIVIPPGTYVTAINGLAYNSNNTLGNSGFNLKIYDKGSKASVFYGDYAQHTTVAGHFDITQDVPSGSGMLLAPFIITGPGVLGWEIVNRSTNALMIQVLIDCAVPITNRSIQNTVVSKG